MDREGLSLPSTRDRGRVYPEPTSIVLMLRTSRLISNTAPVKEVRPSPQLFIGMLCISTLHSSSTYRSPNKALEPTLTIGPFFESDSRAQSAFLALGERGSPMTLGVSAPNWCRR